MCQVLLQGNAGMAATKHTALYQPISGIGCYSTTQELVHGNTPSQVVHGNTPSPQGSVIGPTLWNVMYDTVLRLDMPTDTRIVGFADDIAIVTVAKDIQQAEENTNAAVFRILEWMEANSLSIAAHKTEAVLYNIKACH
ncbi:uncharacterized protein Dwil_GK27315 [Drosophila willistoni]|uniref:Reverse transcriptase domain-containing protein n=1 Tax=Drosophila willistoni TaxID=7260 RepID=A0A0Q9WY33_DROWI|nr:uncharacterized protein Dwil_GK27315 [Drosophila willistoni]